MPNRSPTGSHPSYKLQVLHWQSDSTRSPLTRGRGRADAARGAFTIDSFSRYLLHDPVHHLYDVNKGIEILDRNG